ncbi:MAG TPA: Maf family protein [Ignavibacteriaceae bacterium]|nr:Maf family protein [Ignavibacteriaceae bacterium]
MIKNYPPLILASSSPRRKKLLQQLNLKFRVISVEINEQRNGKESPVTMVKRLAYGKLDSARKSVNDGIIITADTIVVLDNEIIGKPRNKSDAREILKKLSDNTHIVYTGFVVYNSRNDKTIVDYEKTKVTFRKLSSEEIDNYIKTGNPMDKAGAYGIQDDFGAVFVKKINGDYYNVVGLPISKVYSHLLEVI